MRIKWQAMVILIIVIILSGCTRNTNQEQEEWTLVKESVMTFSDGVSVDVWTSDQFWGDFYKLADGTTLLMVFQESGPSNVYVGGIESYDDLNDSTQKAVDEFYDNQGLLYDINFELEKAYSEYQECNSNGSVFNRFMLSQEIAPTASNEHIICFITVVSLPVGMQEMTEQRLGAVFSKENGDVIDIWDLFTSAEEETKQRLLKYSGIKEANLLDEADKALKAENIIMFPDYMEISFTEGSLTSQEQSYYFSIDYKDIQDILHSWAIPDTTQ